MQRWVLARTCFYSIVMEATPQIALLINLAFVARSTSVVGTAAFSAVLGAVTFVVGLFNFLTAVTMSTVGRAVGARDWPRVAGKARVALATSVLSAAAAAALLRAVRDPMLSALMGLDPTVCAIAKSFFDLRLLQLLPSMLQRSCSGLLAGIQRIRLLAVVTFLTSSLDVAGNFVALFVLRGGLVGATLASTVAAGAGAVVLLIMVSTVSPEGCQRAIPIWRCGDHAKGGPSNRSGSTAAPSSSSVETLLADPLVGDLPGGGGSRGDELAGYGSSTRTTRVWPRACRPCSSAVSEYLSASADMVVRSLLLSASVWALTILSGNLSRHSLAAHQVVLQLWMVTSYVVDGFADAGTMLGAKFLGRGDHSAMLRLSSRLVCYSLVVGLLSGVTMYAAQDWLIGVYFPSSRAHGGCNGGGNCTNGTNGMNGTNGTNGHGGDENDLTQARNALRSVWVLLCAMQLPNAAVFVYDGLLYAVGAFRYVRNVMLVGTLVLFAPALVLGFVVGHALIWIWVAKAILNGWRALCAVYLINFVHAKAWRRSQEAMPPGGKEEGKDCGVNYGLLVAACPPEEIPVEPPPQK